MVGVVTGLTILEGAAVIGAISTVGSFVAGQDAAAAQQQQAQVAQQQLAVQQQQAEQANIRSVRQQVRQARAARAAVVNAAAIGGVSQSSGAIGGAGAVGTGLSGELDYFGKMKGLQDQDFALQGQMGSAMAAEGKARGEGAMWGAIGGVANTIFEAKGGWKTVFSDSK